MVIIQNCLHKIKAGNYHNVLSDFLKLFQTLGYNMSLKVKFLDFHFYKDF